MSDNDLVPPRKRTRPEAYTNDQLLAIFQRPSSGDDVSSSENDDDSVADPDYDQDTEIDATETDIEDIETESRDAGSGRVGGDQDVRPTARPRHKQTGTVLTRKRKRDPTTWKCNIRRTLRQTGRQYTDSRGKLQPDRFVTCKKDCSKCKFKCNLNISDTDRSDIFKEFWTLTDNEKMHFYGKTTVKDTTKRSTVAAGYLSRKKSSFTYYLPCHGTNIRVCKVFYLTMLAISQKRVFTYHSSKHVVGGTPKHLLWGQSANNTVPPGVKDGIREHIHSIPRIESHYCRADTKKEYFDRGLSIALLYEKYTAKCIEAGKTPGKLHMYRHIFNYEFNIEFQTPKKDRCDACEAMKMNKQPSEEEKVAREKHLTGKIETKNERDKHRNDKDSFIVCFDLQNVFALPTADISNFFDRRKLNVYHMTAHCSADNRGYGALWHEGQNWRSGNHLASSVMMLLDAIVENNVNDPRIKHITLWSDSCVPQNRNSIFSTAIKVFMKRHPEVLSIVQKFCEPGHSTIQEVDNLHSQIERVCTTSEIYSPVGLLKLLKKVRRNKPMKLIQMKSEYFKDYQAIAKQGQYQRIPYTKVKGLLYKQNEPKVVKYKMRFSDEWISQNVIESKTTRGVELFQISDPKIAKPTILAATKKSDIRDMLKFMPPEDRAYMTLLV